MKLKALQLIGLSFFFNLLLKGMENLLGSGIETRTALGEAVSSISVNMKARNVIPLC